MDTLTALFFSAQQSLFESVVQPLMFALGMGHLLEDAYEGTMWFLLGVIQIAILACVFAPLQRLWPAEAVEDKPAIRVDMLYTLLHRLGIFRIVLFLTLEPVATDLLGIFRVWGMGTWHLDQLWPTVTEQPWVSFILYLLVFDFFAYWLHRAQHQWHVWWALHSLHHSQRQMTVWSDDRNHLLDTLFIDAALALLGQLIGVPPGQFILIVMFTQLSESLQHANLRLSFGRWGERLWVSPRFHRQHHSIGLGHEGQGKGTLGGCNFGVLLPWWDMLFGTACFSSEYAKTGIRDQVEEGRDYGRGFWVQQKLGVKRLLHAVFRRSR